MDKITFEVTDRQEQLLYLALSRYHTQLCRMALNGDDGVKSLEKDVWDLLKQQIIQQTRKKAGQ